MSTGYTSIVREIEYPIGRCREQIVTLSLFDDMDNGYRCVVRQWLTPTRLGPPGIVVYSVLKGVLSISNYIDPAGRTEGIQQAAIAMLTKHKEQVQ
jgi:hypothetical protein